MNGNGLEHELLDTQAAFIRLKGAPYQRVVDALEGREVIDCSKTLDALVQNTDYPRRIVGLIEGVEDYLEPLLQEAGYYTLDRKIKHGENLDFNEFFNEIYQNLQDLLWLLSMDQMKMVMLLLL